MESGRIKMMNTNRSFLVRVIVDYRAPFSDPIQANQGDMVTLDPRRETNIPGWVWCMNESGRSGWVPKAYVEIQGTSGKMLCSYDAIELTVGVGNILTVHKEESEFYWVTNQNGQHGWVPVSHVEPFEDKESLIENQEAS